MNSAGSITVEIDTLGQNYDAIEIYVAAATDAFNFESAATVIAPRTGGNRRVISIPGLAMGSVYKICACLVKKGVKSQPSQSVRQWTHEARAGAPGVVIDFHGSTCLHVWISPAGCKTEGYCVHIVKHPGNPDDQHTPAEVYNSISLPIAVHGICPGITYNLCAMTKHAGRWSARSPMMTVTAPSMASLNPPGIAVAM